MTKNELKKLKSSLPRGSRKIIAERTGKHISAVDQVLRGEFFNQEIIDLALAIAEEHRRNLNLKLQRIKSL